MRGHDVEISLTARAALDDHLEEHIGYISATMEPDRAAWLVAILREMPDDPKLFPTGKWALIQHMEEQVRECANRRAAEIVAAKKEPTP